MDNISINPTIVPLKTWSFRSDLKLNISKSAIDIDDIKTTLHLFNEEDFMNEKEYSYFSVD